MPRQLPLPARAVLLLALAACGSTTVPTPSPGDVTAVLEALALRGFGIERSVSGDAGCDDPALRDNALRLDLRTPTGDSVRAYLLRFRRPAHYDAAADPVTRCVRTLSSSLGRDIARIDERPWRAYGPSWSAEFRAIFADALADVAEPE